jgi:leucyl aminopeptidase
MSMPQLTPVSDASQLGGFDALVLVAPSFTEDSLLPTRLLSSSSSSSGLASTFALARKVDGQVGQAVTLVVSEAAPGGRLILAPTGSLETDTADVRHFGDAARKGVVRARDAGALRPLLVVHATGAAARLHEHSRALEVSLLSALAGLYEPLQARETVADIEPVKELGFWLETGEKGEKISRVVSAIEAGRRLARDVGGSDPERMTPLRCADYIQEALKSGVIKVERVTENLEKDYPLLHAVARSSLHVERHKPVVVRLHYVGSGEDKKESLYFAGKGVTYDTGGADIKTGGHMAGMSRDKCGAANVAGFFKTLELLKPAHLDAYAELGFVRNSCGSNAYVSDEIITSHAGIRVSVGNTDAEGRMVLADCLSHCRVKALSDKTGGVARLMTVCTLTGHAALSVGPYGITLDNSVAKRDRQSFALQEHGEMWGDPLEVTTLRKEDFAFIAPKHKGFDVLQCNTAPSSATPRGHQFPAAFIIKASGLDKHGVFSSQPLAFSQLDIAGGALEDMDQCFGNPTATPLVALTARYVLQDY